MRLQREKHILVEIGQMYGTMVLNPLLHGGMYMRQPVTFLGCHLSDKQMRFVAYFFGQSSPYTSGRLSSILCLLITTRTSNIQKY